MTFKTTKQNTFKEPVEQSKKKPFKFTEWVFAGFCIMVVLHFSGCFHKTPGL